MAKLQQDLTRPPDLAHERGTGPIRVKRPVYQNHLPPCNFACPTGEDIQGWLALAQAGNVEAAWQSLVRNNPFPAISGRICYHNCESACNRQYTDSSVSIHSVERYLGDLAIKNDWQFDKPAHNSGKRIMIVGAGPCGLAAAYHLAMSAHHVEIFDAGPVAGGMMHFGIPAYRLPRDVLEKEIERLTRFGITFHLNHKIEDLRTTQREGRFDAVVLAIGASLSKRIDIPGCDAGKLVDAVALLSKVAQKEEVKIGRRVAIYGGGNTAMDAARTAQRLGAETMIIYRNDREHMAAHDFEAEEALAEDVKIHWLRRIRDVNEGKITVEVMQHNAEGKLEPTGEVETLEADTLVMAIGQQVDAKFLKSLPEIEFSHDGSIVVDRNLMTGRAGVFAGGDMIGGERTATHAFGHGKQVARVLNAWLNNQNYHITLSPALAHFDQLKLHYRTEAPVSQQKTLAMEQRHANFGEVVAGLSDAEALFEARRCFSCGNCFECDGCMAACPSKAISKLGTDFGYEINYQQCTGCGICVDQCPAFAMELIDEPK